MPIKRTMIELVCENCNSHFHIPIGIIRHDPRRGRFCSKKCYGQSKIVPLRQRFEQYCTPKNENGCIIWTGNKCSTYGTIGEAGKMLIASRVSWEIHNGPIPDGLCVLHRCDIPRCVAIEHLFLGTMADNTHDMMAKGRGPSGERCGHSKMTDEKVREIRRRYAAGNIPLDRLGQDYGVTRSTIGYIVRGDTWKHIK